MADEEKSVVDQYLAIENLAEELAKKDLIARYRKGIAEKYESYNKNEDDLLDKSMSTYVTWGDINTYFLGRKKEHMEKLLELRKLEIIVKSKPIIVSPIEGMNLLSKIIQESQE